MAQKNRSAYCTKCGSSVSKGDRFCGVCGARVGSVTLEPVTPENPQMITEPVAQGSEARSNGRLLFLAGVIGTLLILLVGAGAVALVKFGVGSGSVSPDAPPDPAFDLYLSALKGMTEAPIMLPAELPQALNNIGINENVEGDSYSITFLSTPPDDLVGGWGRFETVGSLEVVPESEYQSNQQFDVVSTEDVDLPDGTESKLRYMQPASDTAMYGSRWEGTFDKNGHTYTLWVSLGQNGEEITRQALSSMVEVE
mgnify:CR=1 FL=1